MFTEPIKSSQIKEFLKDYQENAEVYLLEQGSKEQNDLLKRAQAKGYNLKDNTDLAGVKCIYAFTDKANSNGAILPEKPFLKALPTMIGKPINIAHERKMVIGHIIDYSYMKKDKKAIMYGVIYKSNFEDEWKKAQTDFKKKKLNVSFEIWSPKNKRKYLADGTYELYEQEIAGCALLFKEVQPAFDGAKVLALAKKLEKEAPELVYASRYKDDELIVADDINNIIQKTHLKCSNCQNDFDAIVANEIKCPSCLAILNKEGNMIYPPQKKDFRIMCPSCKSSHWKILQRDKEGANIKCLNESMCGKTYEIKWAKKKSASMPNLSYLYMGRISCLQCGKVNEVLGTSKTKIKNVKCSRCGLDFSYDIKENDKYRKIETVKEVNLSETSEKGGNAMKDERKDKKASEEIVEKKDEAKVEDKMEAKEEKVETDEVKDDKKEKAEVEKAEKEQSEAKEEKVEETNSPEKAEDEKAPKAEDVEKAEETKDIYPKTRSLRKAIKKIKETQASLSTAKAEKEEILKNGINKVAKQLIEAKKQVETYKANAQEILKRRTELDGYEISDEDIMNDDKFEKAKLTMENAKLKAEKDDANEIVGVKAKDDEYYERKRKEIHTSAFKTKKDSK